MQAVLRHRNASDRDHVFERQQRKTLFLSAFLHDTDDTIGMTRCRSCENEQTKDEQNGAGMGRSSYPSSFRDKKTELRKTALLLPLVCTLKENQRNLSLLRKSIEPISHYLIQFYIYESEISYGRYIVMYLYPCVFNIVVRASSFSSCQHYAT